VMPVAKVNLEATRAANSEVPDDPSKGTLSIGSGPAFEPPPVVIDEDEAPEPPSKSVTVYSATWCGYCKELKRYLAAKKIPATIIEVDLLPRDGQDAARATMRQMTGRVAYPTVVIGGEALAGFSASWIESKMK
jgi:glutaredoxin